MIKVALASQKGVSLITLLIVIAVLVGVLNVYSYLNPDFQLRRYTFVSFLGQKQDEQRINDLKRLQEAVEAYYDEKNEYPATDGWCGTILSVINPDVKDDIAEYFPDRAIPKDPENPGTSKDYFYRRETRRSYVLMAVLSSPPSDETYNYSGCHDWPGDGVYNYRIEGTR